MPFVLAIDQGNDSNGPAKETKLYDPAVKNRTENMCSKIFHYLKEQIKGLSAEFKNEVF